MWTDQGRADNSWCFWSAYHMLGSRLTTLQALSPSSQLSYAWGTLYDTTDQETEVGRWRCFLQVTILWNLQRQDLNPCLSDPSLQYSVFENEWKALLWKLGLCFISCLIPTWIWSNYVWAEPEKITEIWRWDRCFRLGKQVCVGSKAGLCRRRKLTKLEDVSRDSLGRQMETMCEWGWMPTRIVGCWCART